MFGFNKNNNSWFSWDGMNALFSRNSYECQDDCDYFDKEPERDHIRDWIDIQWDNGNTDFDPSRPL